MQFKKIILFFLVALPLSVALRIIQLTYTIEAATGFFKQEYKTYGGYMLAVIFAFSIAVAIFAFTSHRSPEHPPKPNIFMSVSAVCLCFSILYELAAENFPAVVQPWQIALLKITGVATAVYFMAFALKRFFDFPLPDLCAIIPTVYFILRIICDFTAISSLALISDNLLLMAAYGVSLLFILNFAKLYNRTDREYNFRKLMASGLAAIILCLTQSVPHIIVNAVSDFSYLHTSMEANVTVLFVGVFISAFVFSHFSHQNACE